MTEIVPFRVVPPATRRHPTARRRFDPATTVAHRRPSRRRGRPARARPRGSPPAHDPADRHASPPEDTGTAIVVLVFRSHTILAIPMSSPFLSLTALSRFNAP